MGSHQDLEDATAFISQHRIVPVVHQVIDGLGNAEQGFQIMKDGEQFGKIVVKVNHEDAAKL